MARIDVDLAEDRLRVTFTRTETLLGLVHDLDEPLAEVVAVHRLRDPWLAVHGWRTGLGLRGLWLLGTWWRRGHRQLVALRRDQEALRIMMRSGHYRELLLSTPDPGAVADASSGAESGSIARRRLTSRLDTRPRWPPQDRRGSGRPARRLRPSSRRPRRARW